MKREHIAAAVASGLAALALAFSGGVSWAAAHPHAVHCATEDSCAYSYHDHEGTVVPAKP